MSKIIIKVRRPKAKPLEISKYKVYDHSKLKSESPSLHWEFIFCDIVKQQKIKLKM